MKKLLIICTILSFFQGISQEKFEVRKIGFSMISPKGWYEMKEEATLKNLEKFDLTDEQLTELLRTDSKPLITYTKYDPKKVAGIIPTIKVRTMATENKTIESFRRAVEVSTQDAMKALDDFRFTEKPVAVKISGKDAVKFTAQFNMKSNGKEYKIISQSCYILMKGYFISLNFIDEVGREENAKLFEEIFQSVQLNR